MTTLTQDVLCELLKFYPDGLTREELKKLTGMPRTTLYDRLVKLWMKDLISKRSVKKGKQGRPEIKWFAVV